MDIEQAIISFVQTIGAPAIVSGGVAAFVNYVMTMKALKKKNIAELIEKKLDIYSFIIFYLDRMRFTGEALKKVNNNNIEKEVYANPSNEDIREVFRPIDEKIQNKYHLLNQDIFEQYIYVKTLFAHKSTKDVVPKLRKMLVDEYNNSIIIEYEKITGKKVEKLR